MTLFFDELKRSNLDPKPKTMVIDRMLPGIQESLEWTSGFMTVAKIGWGLPLLLEETEVRKRVQMYRQYGVDVSNGGTMLEIASSKNKTMKAMDHILDAGFTVIELSEGVIDIPNREKKMVAEFAREHAMKLHIEVGRKNAGNQLSLEDTIDGINSALDFEPDLVIIEGRETGRSVEIYDNEGHIKWDWVSRIIENFDQSRIMFEAPLEEQQAQLITKLGPYVNLGNVSLLSVLPLQSQRSGFRGDNFGGFAGTGKVSGSPATKFVYHVISSHLSLDQGQIGSITGLNRRTVQIAIDTLVSQQLIRVSSDPRDMRHRIYSCEKHQ
ncbi:MAG: phosphosulfolactate synthase [Candidatus Thermoplasmatota archaeon]|nr:phosphosulfolactate synthase [Candidatus Thermoplasmatota archaeon]